MKYYLMKALTVLKWIALALLLMFISFPVAVHYINNDPNDAALWAGMLMALIGLLTGALAKRRK